ncbi:MAG: hypothetical protein NTV65_11355 [Proteobacteria bacterium]|nr:hypothetical protein [Pseudomonadota bacterium]
MSTSTAVKGSWSVATEWFNGEPAQAEIARETLVKGAIQVKLT